MTSRTLRLFVVIAALIVAGFLAGLAARRAYRAHIYGFETHMARWEPAPGVTEHRLTPEAMRDLRELHDELARKRRLSKDDLARLFELAERPRVILSEEALWASPEENEEARAGISANITREVAEMILEERLREDASLDDATKQRIIAHILAKLESPDPNVRIEGMAAIVSTELVREPEYRVRIEVMRGDPDRSVAETAARKLHHWDRAN